MDFEYIDKLIYIDDDMLLRWRKRSVEFFSDTVGRSARGNCNLWNGRFSGKLALYSLSEGKYRKGAIQGKSFRYHRALFILYHKKKY